MENQIFIIDSTWWKSVVLKDNELWLSQGKVSSLEKFEKALQKTGMMKNAYSYPLSSVSEVSYNEASESVKLIYKDEEGKDKKLKMNFGDRELSNNFGRFLGEKLEMTKSQQQEGHTKPLLLNLFYLLVTIGCTISVLAIDDSTDLSDGGTRRSRRNKAFLKMILDTIGQTGVIIIGTLVSIYLIHKLYKRYKTPANEIVYKR